MKKTALLRPAGITHLKGDYSRAKAAELGWEPVTRLDGLIQLMVDADL